MVDPKTLGPEGDNGPFFSQASVAEVRRADPNSTPRTIAYIRVSTDKQDEDSQRQIIAEWCQHHAVTISGFATDQASGALPWQERALAFALRAAKKGDAIIVSEVSRIARSTVGVLTFLEAAAAAGVSVVAVRSGISLDGSNASKIVVTVLAMAAEVERDLLRERTRAALASRKAAGAVLGRPVGSTSKSKLDAQAEQLRYWRKHKVSDVGIARMVKCSRHTVATWFKNNPEVKDAA